MNWVELRTNVFGSEQKSLRAWQCSGRDAREDDMRWGWRESDHRGKS